MILQGFLFPKTRLMVAGGASGIVNVRQDGHFRHGAIDAARHKNGVFFKMLTDWRVGSLTGK